MIMMIKKVAALFILLLVVTLVIRESSFHFNTDIVEIKRKHSSAQRHWNIGYSQYYVYYDSPIRYQEDLRAISSIIEPGYALLSDLTTSYYAAATLPVYVINVHPHHKSKRSVGLVPFLISFCHMDDALHRQLVVDFLQRDARLAQKRNWPELRYVILNKDRKNFLLQKECLALRNHRIRPALLDIGRLLYEGEFLDVYQLVPAKVPERD